MEKFPEGWEILVNQVVNEGKSFKCSNLLAHQLSIHICNSLNPPKGEKVIFYMFAYLLDAICAHNAFPGMN